MRAYVTFSLTVRVKMSVYLTYIYTHKTDTQTDSTEMEILSELFRVLYCACVQVNVQVKTAYNIKQNF